jgi:uncharacterized protein with GYD domain
MRKITPDGTKDEVTYVYLINDIQREARLTASQRKKEIGEVNDAVKKEGGVCRLYMTPGGAYEYVSVITGIGAAAAIRIATEIERRGSVKATMLTGMEVFSSS